MRTDSGHDPLAIDRYGVRTTAITLAVWLTITLAAVVLLLQFGEPVSDLFV